MNINPLAFDKYKTTNNSELAGLWGFTIRWTFRNRVTNNRTERPQNVHRKHAPILIGTKYVGMFSPSADSDTYKGLSIHLVH